MLLTVVLQLIKNVSCVFTKFVSEGKCTIRLCEPPVDIAVSKVKCLIPWVSEPLVHSSLQYVTLISTGPHTVKMGNFGIAFKVYILHYLPYFKDFCLCCLMLMSVSFCSFHSANKKVVNAPFITNF